MCLLFLDYPECDDDVCDQLCFETFGSYYCACFAGYYLSHDNHSCEGMFSIPDNLERHHNMHTLTNSIVIVSSNLHRL